MEEAAALRGACTSMNTFLYFVWVLPLVLASCNIASALLLWVAKRVSADLQASDTAEAAQATPEQLRTRDKLKWFLIALGTCLFMFSSATSAVSAVSIDLSQSITVFFVGRS